MDTRIVVLGRLRVLGGDLGRSCGCFEGRKPRQVLQILAANHDRVVSKEHLADLLWPCSPPVAPSATVEHYVAVLRRCLNTAAGTEVSVVRTEGSGYRLDTDSASLDLADFRSAVGDLDTWLHLDRIRAALLLSEGSAFAEEPDSEWAEDVRREVEGRRCDLLVRAAELGIVEGDPLAAAHDASAAIVAEPHLESAHRVLIAAHYLRGDQARALAAFRSLRARLVDELGVEPTPHTRQLHAAVLEHCRADQIQRLLVVPQGLRPA